MSAVPDVQQMVNRDTPKELRRQMDIGDIWSNAAHCLDCGDTIRSRNRHDFVTCSCGNISVDGGSWYARRSVKGHYENLIEYFDDAEEEE